MAVANSKKEETFRDVLARFADECSMQGISRIGAAKVWWSRLIWVVLTLAAIGALTIHLYRTISQYYEYPVQTQVSLGFSNLQLPAITICNTNVLRKSKMNISNSTSILRKEIDQMGRTINVKGEPSLNKASMSKDDYDYSEDYYYDEHKGGIGKQHFEREKGYIQNQRFKANYMDMPREDRKNAGHFIDEMIVSCSFAGRECTEKAFKLRQTADYGNCWEFNTTNKITTKPGEIAGLTLTLNLQNWEILEEVSEGYGARLVIHEPGTIPLPSSEGIFISSYFETNIGLRMVSFSRLGKPYSKCDNGKNFQKRYGITYSRESCQFMCLTSAVIRRCGCYDDSEEELAIHMQGTKRLCNSKTDIACYREVFSDYRDKELSCDCLNPCTEVGYVKTMSSRPWPTDEHLKRLVNAVCSKNTEMCDIMKKSYKDNRTLGYNFLKLNVYFEDLNFEMIQETPEMTVEKLMSEVGGAVGLWIGLSAMAVFEIFQLIFELCALCIHKIKH